MEQESDQDMHKALWSRPSQILTSFHISTNNPHAHTHTVLKLFFLFL